MSDQVKTVNVLASSEYVLTPPEIGPLVQFGSRVVDLREVPEDVLQRMLNSPLTENFLNRDKRRAPQAAPATPAEDDAQAAKKKKKDQQQ